MSAFFEQLFQTFTNPVTLFGHFTYTLLIISMLQRRMVLLRIFAVAASLSKIVYRSVFLFEPGTVMWEAILVVINVGQLLIIWYYARHHRFEADHKHFADALPGADRRAVKRLLDHSDIKTYEAGRQLTREGESVGQLFYITEGIVKVERGERLVAICGPGDFVGELSFVSGNPATATATAVKPTRMLVFEQARLNASIATDVQLRRTLEAALNVNLAGKLMRANDAAPAGEAA